MLFLRKTGETIWKFPLSTNLPISEQFFHDPPLCPNFKNEILPPLKASFLIQSNWLAFFSSIALHQERSTGDEVDQTCIIAKFSNSTRTNSFHTVGSRESSSQSKEKEHSSQRIICLQLLLHQPPPTAKFASQSDANMRTNAQIKFLYYTLEVHYGLLPKRSFYSPNLITLGPL